MRSIDADALKKAVNDKRAVGRFNTIMLIDEAPTLPNEYMRGYEAAEREYKRPTGKWIDKTISTFIQYQPNEYICPFCGKVEHRKYDYCHCGADLRSGADSRRGDIEE